MEYTNINFTKIAAELNKTDFDLNRVNEVWGYVAETFEFNEDCWDYEEGVESAYRVFESYDEYLTTDEYDMIKYIMVEEFGWEKE
jgi:hypothetical protein